MIVERGWSDALPWLFDALPLVVFAVLIVRYRRALVAPELESRHRVLLAVMAGWLSGLVYRLDADWLFGLPDVSGTLLPGALFGLLVLSPLLRAPARHPIRVVVLVAAGTLAHFLAWFIGVWLFELISDRLAEPLEGLVVMAGSLGGPALIAFGVLAALAARQVVGLRPTFKFWLAVLAGSWLSGWLYQAAVLDMFEELLPLSGEWFDYDIYVAYALWYALLSVTLGLAPREPPPAVRRLDLVLLAGLGVGWLWMAWIVLSDGF